MSDTVFQRAFAGGELAPSLAARADQAKYLTGLRTCRNFIVQRHGGVANRPGTRFVGETRDSSTATFLLRYVSETWPATRVLIEAGPFYLRFYKNGALVRLSAVDAWTRATNYAIGDIASRRRQLLRREGGHNGTCRRRRDVLVCDADRHLRAADAVRQPASTGARAAR
jgi:hypothetical protein